MRVLVAFEFSGIVRDAFIARGHSAWSCDLLPSEGKPLGHWYPDHYPPGHQLADKQEHFHCDVRELFPGGRVYQNVMLENQVPKWDMVIAFPPCTHLAVSGARWFKDKVEEQKEAIAFVEWLWNLDVPRIAIENPVGILSTRSSLGKPTQIIQPWQFGHGETKATCLWLKGLPKLAPMSIVEGREPRVHHASPGPDRWKERSRTLPGIAIAMAQQWGGGVQVDRGVLPKGTAAE